MKHEDLRRVVVNDTLVCPGCRRAVRVLLGDNEGEGRQVERVNAGQYL